MGQRRTYWRDFTAYMAATYPDITDIAQVRRAHCETFVRHLIDHGRFCKDIQYDLQKGKRTKRVSYTVDRGLAPKTIKAIVSVCSWVFTKVSEDAGLIGNPWNGVVLPAKAPIARDVFYHTADPLSAPGWKLLELLDALHDARDDETARTLLPTLYRLTVRNLESSSAAPVLKVRRLWDQINTFLREHRNEPVPREAVAGLFRVSPGYVSELCKKYSGESFTHLKLRYQLEHAKNLLLHTRLSVDEIAEQSGFSCANYFIRRFKQVYKATPHVYRNRPPEP